jgi:hypothetical protein
MSNALAIAGVSAVLRALLQSWLDGNDANAALNGASAHVSAIAPDLVPLTGANAGPRLNLFLHQVSPNQGWREVGLPSRDAQGHRTSSPPLALDLHYLLTAYGPEELQAEVLLGYGMQLLHEMPVLDRQTIEDRLPPDLASSQLGRQVELIKLVPEPMGAEELSRLWTALQAKFRPTAGYRASVVLIEANGNGQAALPVLTRTINPALGLEPALPAITAVRPPNDQPGAALGDAVTVEGHHLDGTNRAVRLQSTLHDVDREIAAAAGGAAGSLQFTVPNLTAALAIGSYELSALVQRPGESVRRETNRLVLTLLPRITTALPLTVARDAQGTATIELAVRPQVRLYQRATLVLGSLEVPAADRTAASAPLTFVVPNAPAGTHLVRVRVDGIETPIVDRSVTPPAFLDRRVVIT